MRRSLVVLALALAALGGGLADADAAPVDNVPGTYGTLDGDVGCDVGYCWGDVLLDGRFAFTDMRPRPLTDAIQTTATLRWQLPSHSNVTRATITSPRFDGLCDLRRQHITIDPVAGTQHSWLANCTATIDGGPRGGNVSFSFSTDLGRFFPSLNWVDHSPI